MKKNEGSGITALNAAITAKKEEISLLKAELKTVESDAVKTVNTERKLQSAISELEALETALEAASYTQPTPTEQETLLQGLEKYKTEWQERINKIRADIEKSDETIAQIEKELNQAALDADATATLELSHKKEFEKDLQVHLVEMLARAEALPLYPENAISEEWAEICKGILPKWEGLIEQIRIFAEAYTKAVNALVELSMTLKATRTQLENEAGYNACQSLLTIDRTAEGLTIEAAARAKINNIFSPIDSQKL